MDEPQLQDIHFAANADFWPLALGWWILISLVLLGIAWLLFEAFKQAKKKRKQRKVLVRFSLLEKKLTAEPSNAVIAEINTLLRQLAITYYPRERIASLTGSDWLQFLDNSGRTQDFSRGAGRILVEAPYRLEKQVENLNSDEFLPLVKNWIKRIIKASS